MMVITGESPIHRNKKIKISPRRLRQVCGGKFSVQCIIIL